MPVSAADVVENVLDAMGRSWDAIRRGAAAALDAGRTLVATAGDGCGGRDKPPIKVLFWSLRAEILAAAPVDFHDPAVEASMMSQLIAGQGDSVTCNEIIPNLYLGRARDTENAGYDLVVCATNSARELHASLLFVPRIQLPIIVDGVDVSADAASHGKKDVGPESFAWEEQGPLRMALSAMDRVLCTGGRVFVCCQQGKDRSALVVLAYLRARFRVPPGHLYNLYNFLQSKRCSVTTREIPKLWGFLKDQFDAPRAEGALASASGIPVR